MVDETETAAAAAADADAPPQINGEQIEFVLSHRLAVPIRAHGEDVNELKWREPTAGDIERAGNPITLDFQEGSEYPRMSFNERKMNAMISLLAGIPPSSVRMMSAGDWQTVAYKMSRFFMPRAG